MSNVTSILKHSTTSDGKTPEMVLIEAQERLRDHPALNKCVVVLLEDHDDVFQTDISWSDMYQSEAFAILTTAAQDVYRVWHG